MTMLLPLLFSFTLFLNAFLLFSVQPMFAKMILPLLGGAPQVWNTCMMFFQIALLAGYGYAHWQAASARFSRGRFFLHLGILVLAFIILPIQRSPWMQAEPPVDSNPILWLLSLLLLSVGLPFLMVSSGAPLFQNWFSKTKHPDAKDPYFLYAASNLGSFVALLAYPFIFEPLFGLQTQSRLWTFGYGLLILFTGLCAWMAQNNASEKNFESHESGEVPGISWKERLYWIALAFVPSSWMLGVTTYISTDIAAIPLLWIIPLSIYLLSFVIVFAKNGGRWTQTASWIFPIVVAPLITMNQTERPLWLLMPWNLLCFFLGTIMLHGALAQRRPQVRYLTEFYLWLSMGGMLGGIFNALLAPSLFNSIMEYPLMLIAACFVRPVQEMPRKKNDALLDWVLPAGVGISVFVLTQLVLKVPSEMKTLEKLISAAYVVIPVLWCFSFRYRRLRFALAIGAYFFAGMITDTGEVHRLHAERTFFGVHRVNYKVKENMNSLVHGRTVHGYQSLDPARRREPLGYYHRNSPVGQILENRGNKSRIGFVGLGAGALAAYGRPGESWTFFEIDPEVQQIAENPKFFSYLPDCKANYNVVLGDARLSLQKEPDGSFDILIVDAFSSDAIPVHLITREAFELYFQKLKAGGVLALHISNRYLDLEPVVGGNAERLGLSAYLQFDVRKPEEEAKGFASSRWVMVGRSKEDLAFMSPETGGKWQSARSGVYWTDSFSDIFGVYRPSFDWSLDNLFGEKKPS